jgi:hypothetical protein
MLDYELVEDLPEAPVAEDLPAGEEDMQRAMAANERRPRRKRK